MRDKVIAIILGVVVLILGYFLKTSNNKILENENSTQTVRDSLKTVKLERNVYKSESFYYLCQLIIQEGPNDTSYHNYTPAMVEWAKDNIERADSNYTKSIQATY